MKKNEDKGLVLYVLQRMNLSMKSDKQGEKDQKEKEIRKKGMKIKEKAIEKLKKIY